VTLNVGFLPPPDFEAQTMEEFMVLGHIMTAMPAINAIPAVVAAAPGIVTYSDLPLVLPRSVVPRA
jgi:2,4-diaminopentanoate dehydrogenase